jgi:hypothetical protein
MPGFSAEVHLLQGAVKFDEYMSGLTTLYETVRPVCSSKPPNNILRLRIKAIQLFSK